MDEQFAEFIGIFMGDGSLNIREHKHSYEFKFTGNLKDEIPYFENHVAILGGHVLKRKIIAKILDGGRSVGLYFCSKSLANTFRLLGINSGPKSEKLFIPRDIAENKKFLIAFIRGIFDTDGCLTLKKNGRYPVITIAMKARKLLEQIKMGLEGFGIKSCISFDVAYLDKRNGKTYTKHYLSINGRTRIMQWFEIIGSNNPKIIKKYQNIKKV